MAEIVEEGPTEYEGKHKCSVCKTKFIATTEDLGVGGFKKDPNTYWFDGSATAVDKYYALCPHGCGVVIIPDKNIPKSAKRKAVRDLQWQRAALAEGGPRCDCRQWQTRGVETTLATMSSRWKPEDYPVLRFAPSRCATRATRT